MVATGPLNSENTGGVPGNLDNTVSETGDRAARPPSAGAAIGPSNTTFPPQPDTAATSTEPNTRSTIGHRMNSKNIDSGKLVSLRGSPQMQLIKAFSQATNPTETDPRLKSAKPQRVRLRSLAARAVYGFLTIAAILTLPVLAQAQTTIWSSTLTVRTLDTSTFGCSNFIGSNSCSTYLSDDDFTHDRTTLRFVSIFVSPPSSLRLSLSNDLASSAENLTLNIDGMSFAFDESVDQPIDSVKLWNNTGLSWSQGDTVSLTITDPNGTPGAPETPTAPSIGATDGSNTSLDVGWLKPALAGPNVKYYLRHRRKLNDTLWAPWWNGPQNVTINFATITGLQTGSTYEVQVLANNNNGDSEWSPSGTGRTDSGEAPGAPTNLTATANGEDRINLSWTAPSSEGGTIPSNPGEPDNQMEDDRIRSYKIEVRSAASNWLVLDRTIGSTDTEYSHRDVPAGVIRCYRVSATNTAGTGPPSNEAVATTDGAEGTCDDPPTPDPQMQQSQTPLAASFVSVPATHDGETPFWLELSFDAEVVQGSKLNIRDLLSVTGGSRTRLRRKDNQLDHWQIRIDPASQNAVTVTLSPSPPCGETGAVCTGDGRTFTTGLATQIHGPASGNNNWSDESAGTAVTPVPALPLAGVGILGLLLALLGSRRRLNDRRQLNASRGR